MTAAPLQHQLPALARHADVLSKHPATLEASIPGFGKTFVAGFLAQYLGRRPGVLCPKAVIPHWREALDAVGVRPLFVTNYEQAKLASFDHGRWAVRGRTYEWKLPDNAMLVFDECQRCADRTTQNAKLMVAAAREHRITVPMSATAAKDPLDMYALGLLLGLHKGVDYLGWAMNLGVVRGRFAFEYRGGIDGLNRLNKLIFPDHGYRATYEDIPGFPENTIETVGVPVADPEQINELYERVEELQLLESAALEPVVARLRARQQAELLKIPSLVEMTRDAVAEGQSVVIFVNFIDTLEAIQEKLKRKCGVVRGGQSEFARQAEINAFQENRISVLICQIRSGGIGVSLHDVHGQHPRLALISPPDSARDLIQALGRIHRSGAKSPAVQKIVFAEGTVESKVRRAVERKVRQIETLNDGDLDPVEFQDPKAA